MTAARLGLPETSWPAADRALWDALTREGDVFDDGGAFARLKPLTVRTRRAAYGYWLGFLARDGVALDASRPTERATVDRVRRYVDSLAHLSPATRAQRLTALELIMRAAAPDEDWAWLLATAARLEKRYARQGPTRRPADEVSAVTLLRLAQDLLDEAETETRLSPRTLAMRARDGAAIMALLHLPLRIANFAALSLGGSLTERGDAYVVCIEPEATKAGRAIVATLAPRPSDALRSYIERHRPRLAVPGVSGDAVWLTETGTPYRPYVFSERIACITKQRLGVRVSAHRFRACAATLIAEHAPEQMGVAQALLSHRTRLMVDQHYNRARMRAVVERYAHEVRRLANPRR